MVALSAVRDSNALIAKTLPSSYVAVFVGGTKGIGAYALTTLARYSSSLTPRIYVLARSSSPAIAQAQSLAPNATITFISCDASLMRDVDRVCSEIKAKEKSINLLYMSQGTLDFNANTSEGLPTMASLAYYSRIRFAQNLLPQLTAATGLKRVVNVLSGSKEGPVDANDWHMRNLKGIPSPSKLRGQGTSMLTLAMEQVSKEAGGKVGFVHNFPGLVVTDVGKSMPGVLGFMMRISSAIVAPFFAVGGEECGERQVFAATSAKYDGSEKGGVEMEGIGRAKGTNGVGNYSVDEHGEDGHFEEVLKQIREKGELKKMWEDTKLNTDKALNS